MLQTLIELTINTSRVNDINISSTNDTLINSINDIN